MTRFECADLVLSPSVVAVRLRQPDLDTQCRIVADELAVGSPLDDVTEGFQPISRLMARHGVDQRDDEFLGQRRQRQVAVRVAEAFEDAAA